MSVQLIFTGNSDSIMAEMLAFMRGAGPIVAAAAARAQQPPAEAQAVEHTAATPEAPAAGEQAAEQPKARRTRQKAEPAPQATEPAAPAEPAADLNEAREVPGVKSNSTVIEPAAEPAPAEPEITAEMIVDLAKEKILEVGTDAVREIAVRYGIKKFGAFPDGTDLKAVYAALQALQAPKA